MSKKESRILCTLSEYKKSDMYNIQRRGGILPYTFVDKKIQICFGVDKSSQDITDFAGTIEPGENVIDGMIREFHEETCGIFGDISHDDLLNCYCIYDEKNIVLFLPVKFDDEKMQKDIINITKNIFLLISNIKYKDIKKYNENSGIRWLDEEALNVFFIQKRQKNIHGNMFMYTYRLISSCLALTQSMGFLKHYLYSF